jgi:nucleotide-binding universal stress UspA family protein
MQEGQTMNFKRVLIAVDETTFAAHAADVGMDLAIQLGAEVAFVAVLDSATITYDPNSDNSADDWLAMLKDNVKHLLKAFASRRAISPTPLEFLEVGNPAAKIVEAARSWPADLIVMGSHGRNAIANVLLGSVAQEVLHHAPCPVMVVRAQ